MAKILEQLETLAKEGKTKKKSVTKRKTHKQKISALKTQAKKLMRDEERAKKVLEKIKVKKVEVHEKMKTVKEQKGRLTHKDLHRTAAGRLGMNKLIPLMHMPVEK